MGVARFLHLPRQVEPPEIEVAVVGRDRKERRSGIPVHVHLVREGVPFVVELQPLHAEGVAVHLGVDGSGVGREGGFLIIGEIRHRQRNQIFLGDGGAHVFALDIFLTVNQPGRFAWAEQSGSLREDGGEGDVVRGLHIASQLEPFRKEAAADFAAEDADGEVFVRFHIRARFDDDAALELAVADDGVRHVDAVASGGIGESDKPFILAAVEFGMAVGHQQGGIDVRNADPRCTGVNFAAVEVQFRVLSALHDDQGVARAAVVNAERPAVERKGSPFDREQQVLSVGGVVVGLDVHLAAVFAVLDRQTAFDADSRLKRRRFAEKAHGMAVEIERYRSALDDGAEIPGAGVQSGRVNVGIELDIRYAAAQRGTQLRIGGYKLRRALAVAAVRGRCRDLQSGRETKQHDQSEQQAEQPLLGG